MSCRHEVIEVLPPPPPKLRCTHCHLTLEESELDGGYCPECLDVSGRKHSDFEVEAGPDADGPRYRCDACGVLIGDDRAS